jgi:hypothetical protein
MPSQTPAPKRINPEEVAEQVADTAAKIEAMTQKLAET